MDSATDWQRAKALFNACLEIEPTARSQFLERECADAPGVRAEVESLLAAAAHASQFLEKPAAERATNGATPQQMIGQHLGAYQIVSLLGAGGMGEVYRAVRADNQYRQDVAIKLVRRGLRGALTLARFSAERQILARLDHPNIARLLDAGLTADEQPYFIMQLVEGEPIDRYCDRHGLSVRDRLQLFSEVCSAVQYAHQNLTVHRDLKPANILVTKEGVPKLLDFGIAKVLDPEAHRSDDGASMWAMTPEYASPEQVRGGSITTASDVYSLGVILFRLLCNRSPYRSTVAEPFALAKEVCDTEPSRPSATVPGKGFGNGAAGKRKQLSGDLDSIVLMALRKDPAARYATADLLRADIERYLAGMPVTARRGSTGYRVRKFIARNKFAAAAGGLTAVTVLVSLVVVSVLFVRLKASADETTAALSASRAVADFLEHDVLSAANPEITEQPSIPVREVLDRASHYVDSRFAGLPLQAAAVHRALGQAWHGVGDDALARMEMMAGITALQGRDDSASATERLSAINALAEFAIKREDYAGAQAILQQFPPVSYAARSPAEHAQRLYARALRGEVLAHQGDFKSGVGDMRRVLDEAIRALGPEHPQVLGIRSRLAGSLLDAGSYPEAEREFRSLIRDRERALGGAGVGTLDAREYLAELLVLQGREAEALPMLEHLYAEEAALFGADDPRVNDTGQTLAAAYDNHGDAEKSESLYLQLIASSERRLGAESSRTLGAKRNLATLYIGLKQCDRALPIEESILTVYERTGRGTTRFAIQVRRDIGTCLNLLGRWAEAVRINQRAAADAQRYLAEGDVIRSLTQCDLATSLSHTGHSALARKHYEEGIAGLIAGLGPDHAVTRRYIAERDASEHPEQAIGTALN